MNEFLSSEILNIRLDVIWWNSMSLLSQVVWIWSRRLWRKFSGLSSTRWTGIKVWRSQCPVQWGLMESSLFWWKEKKRNEKKREKNHLKSKAGEWPAQWQLFRKGCGSSYKLQDGQNSAKSHWCKKASMWAAVKRSRVCRAGETSLPAPSLLARPCRSSVQAGDLTGEIKHRSNCNWWCRNSPWRKHQCIKYLVTGEWKKCHQLKYV